MTVRDPDMPSIPRQGIGGVSTYHAQLEGVAEGGNGLGRNGGVN